MKDVNDRMANIECGQESIEQDQMTTDETMAWTVGQIHKIEDELDHQEQYSRRVLLNDNNNS